MNNVIKGRPYEYSTIIEQVANAISKLDIPLSKIILFGSVARGDHSLASDIDLAVITTETINKAQRNMVARTIAEFETLETLLEINCYYATDELLNNAIHWSDPCTSIRNEGVVLWQKERS